MATTYAILPPFGCVGTTHTTNDIYIAASIATRVSMIISDFCVIASIWHYTHRGIKIQIQIKRGGWTSRSSLQIIMLRDGALYFLVVAVINVATLLVDTIEQIDVNIAALLSALSSILVSQFLMHLREAADRSTGELGTRSSSRTNSTRESATQSWLSSAEFAATIGDHSDHSDHFDNIDAFSDVEDDYALSRDDETEGQHQQRGIQLRVLASAGQQ